MSTIKTEITSVITLELTDGEAGALAQICSYDSKIFLKWFEENCGKSYIEPYRQHIKTLFDKARILKYAVDKVEKMRKEFPKNIQI